MVNVLDVPVQGNLLFEGGRNVSSSSLDSAVFTLDPTDKYLPPGVRRATTTSAIHARKAHLPAMTRRNVKAPHNSSNKAEGAPQTSKTTQALLILERRRSLLSVFHRMRQTRSAGSNTNSNLMWPRKIFSRADQPTKQHVPDPLEEVAKLYDRAPSLPPTRIGDEFEMPIQIPSTAGNTDRAPTALKVYPARLKNTLSPLEQQLSYSDSSQSALPNEKEQGVEHGHATSSVRNSENSFLSSYDTPTEQLRDTLPCFAPTPADDTTSSENSDRNHLAPDAGETFTDPTKMPLDEQTIDSDGAPSTETLGSLELDFHFPKYGYAESLASYATSANFSPCLASNTTHSGPMSPYHLSQPETPIMSELGDEFLPPLRDPESLAQMGWGTSSDVDLLQARPSSIIDPQLPRPRQGDPEASSGGFQGYSLPNHDHASVLTIRKLPSITFKQTDGPPGFSQKGSKQDLVHSWNDGSEHRMAALGELLDFDDLGYLAEMIN